jgi:hypothetical protein
MTGRRWCEVHVGADRVRVVPPTGEPWEGSAPEQLTEAERARLGGEGPVRLWLAAPDIYLLPEGPGRRSAARVIAEDAPLRRDRLGWGRSPAGVVIAHRDRLEALAAIFGTQEIVADVDGQAVRLRWGAERAHAAWAALVLLATIPFSTWGLAKLAARDLAAARIATAAPAAEPAAGPAVSAVVAALATSLPRDAALHALSGQGPTITAEIDTPDPDLLRAALRRDPRLAALRDVDQRAVPDGRIRVRVQGAFR